VPTTELFFARCADAYLKPILASWRTCLSALVLTGRLGSSEEGLRAVDAFAARGLGRVCAWSFRSSRPNCRRLNFPCDQRKETLGTSNSLGIYNGSHFDLLVLLQTFPNQVLELLVGVKFGGSLMSLAHA
jgi:hypothetical protein